MVTVKFNSQHPRKIIRGVGERRSGGETAVEVRGDGREETEGQGNGAQKW